MFTDTFIRIFYSFYSVRTETFINTPEKACKFIEQFDFSVFAFDVETWDKSTHEPTADWYNLEIFGLSLCNHKDAAYIDLSSFSDEQRLAFFIQLGKELPRNGKGKTVIAHNITFDMKALYKEHISLFNAEWFDTMIADHLIDENKKHGLKDVVVREGLADKSVAFADAFEHGVQSEQFYKYGLLDSVWAYKLAKKQKPVLKRQGLETLFRKVEMPFLRCIQQMEQTGIRLDQKRFEKTKKQLQRDLLDLEVQMLEAANIPYEMQGSLVSGELWPKSSFNWNSNQQLQKLLFEDLGLPVQDETDAGNPSTGDSSLRKLKGKHPLIEPLIKYKKYSKLLSAFFSSDDYTPDADGRIRASFWDHGTVTGRLSSSGPNLQQLPNPSCLECGSGNVADGICNSCGNDEVPDVRACFVASEGKKIIASDFSQQETVIMAHLSGDDNLIQTLKEGKDLHLINAKAVFDLPIPEEALVKSHSDYADYKEKYQEERRKGKVLSFSIPYGASEYKIAKEFDCSVDQGEKYLEKFFTQFPGLQEAIDAAHRSVDEKGYVTNLLGRRRRFEKQVVEKPWGETVEEYTGSAYRQSFNFQIQSLGTDLLRVACVKILNYSNKFPERGVRLLAPIHDELLLEANEEYAQQVADDVAKLMASCSNLAVPLGADADIGKNYSTAK